MKYKNVLLKIFSILLLLLFIVNSSYALNDSKLVSWYQLYSDGTDSTNNSNDCTNSGVDFSGGDYGIFDGTADYLDCDTLLTDISTNTQGSVSLWLNSDDVTSTLQGLFSVADKGVSTSRMRFALLNGKGNLAINDGTWVITVDGNSALTISTDYHIVITQDGTTSKMYINGVLQTDTDSGEWFNDLSNLDNIVIGTDAQLESYYYDGKIWDLAVWDDDLTSDEVGELYVSGFTYDDLTIGNETPVNETPANVTLSNALVNYKFENNYLDSSDNDNDATNSGTSFASTYNSTFGTYSADFEYSESDTIDTNTDFEYNNTEGWSVGLMYYHESDVGSNNEIWGQRGTQRAQLYLEEYSGWAYRLNLVHSGGTYLETGGSPVVGNWHCLVTTVKDGEQLLYENGVAIINTTSTLGTLNPDQNMFLGSAEDIGGYLDGRIDEFTMFDTFLNSTEVEYFCNNGIVYDTSPTLTVNILNITANSDTLVNDTTFSVNDITFNVTYEVNNSDIGNFTNSSIITLNDLDNGVYYQQFEVCYNSTCDTSINYTYTVNVTTPLSNLVYLDTTGQNTTFNTSSILDYVNITSNTTALPRITITNPSSTKVVDNVNMTSVSGDLYQYPTNVNLNSAGNWTLRINVTDIYGEEFTIASNLSVSAIATPSGTITLSSITANDNPFINLTFFNTTNDITFIVEMLNISTNDNINLTTLITNSTGDIVFNRTQQTKQIIQTSNQWIEYGILPLVEKSYKGSIFKQNNQTHFVYSDIIGDRAGFTLNGGIWILNTTLVNGLSSVGDSVPDSTSFEIFQMNNQTHTIYGNSTNLYGFTWDSNSWVSNSSLLVGLNTSYVYNGMIIYNLSSQLNLITNSDTTYTDIIGYTWNGSTWISNNTIINGITDYSLLGQTIETINNNTYIISGAIKSYWGGDTWIKFSNDTFSVYAPTVGTIDNTTYLISGGDRRSRDITIYELNESYDLKGIFNISNLAHDTYNVSFYAFNNETSNTNTYTFYVSEFNTTTTSLGQLFVYNTTTSITCEDNTVQVSPYTTETNITWYLNDVQVLSGNETVNTLNLTDISAGLDDNITVTCNITSNIGTYYSTNTTTVSNYTFDIQINSKDSINTTLPSNTDTIFQLQLSQDFDTITSYNLTDNLNSIYGNITYESSTFNIDNDSLKIINMTLSTGVTPINDTIFNITLTRIGGDIDIFTFNLSINNDIATLTISPTGIIIENLYDDSDIYTNFIVKSTGYNSTGCSIYGTDNLDNYISINISEPFTLIDNISKNLTLSITNPRASLYSGTILLRCTNATTSGQTIESSIGVPYLVLSVARPVIPSSGGGGGSVSIDDDVGKVECDIDVSVSNIALTSRNTQQSITIKNNEDFGYSPITEFQYISGQTNLFDKLRQTNVIDFIETSSQAVTGVRLSSPIPIGTATGEVILSSDNCLDIVIPITINIEETPVISSEIIDFLTDEDTTVEQKVEQLKDKTLYYDSPATSVLGLTMMFLGLFILLKLPITKKKKFKYNTEGAGKYISLAILQIIIETIIVFIILFMWQSYLL